MTHSSGFAVENSRCVMSTWAVRWSAQGLGPIRLVALFKQSCDIPAGKIVITIVIIVVVVADVVIVVAVVVSFEVPKDLSLGRLIVPCSGVRGLTSLWSDSVVVAH